MPTDNPLKIFYELVVVNIFIRDLMFIDMKVVTLRVMIVDQHSFSGLNVHRK